MINNNNVNLGSGEERFNKLKEIAESSWCDCDYLIPPFIRDLLESLENQEEEE